MWVQFLNTLNMAPKIIIITIIIPFRVLHIFVSLLYLVQIEYQNVSKNVQDSSQYSDRSR